MTIASDVRAATEPCSAIVLGSTGNVGRQIVNLLIESPAASQVVVVNRRQTDGFKNAPKVREVVVPDMIGLADAVESAVRETGAIVGFCAIGVGKGSRTMPEAQVRRIEVEYPEAFARGCKAGGVLSLGLMTAAGADVRSSFAYVRTIGEKEAAVINAGIAKLGIYKPSVIYGNSNTPAYLDRIFPAFEWLLPSRFHGIHKNELACAMFEGTLDALEEAKRELDHNGEHARPQVMFYEYRDMKPLFSRRTS